MHPDLIPRDIDILSLLISEYIATANPVASASIAARSSLGLSSATIRSVLAKLEEAGLLTHPHTSAGRVPTPSGLRFYVNNILGQRDLNDDEKAAIQMQFGETSSVEEVLKRTGKILSLVSNYTGLVVMPKPEQISFKHMEFLPLGTGKILGIFVSREGMVHNRVIEVDKDLTYPELEKITNFCNQKYYGFTLSEAAQIAKSEIEECQQKLDQLMSRALSWSAALLDDAAQSELLVRGETNLLKAPEFANVENLKSVMQALEEKKHLMQLLRSAENSDEICVFIGAESGYSPLENCSIVTTPYKSGKRTVGTLGVIGPMRMNYSKVIPTVDFTAQIVSALLGK